MIVEKTLFGLLCNPNRESGRRKMPSSPSWRYSSMISSTRSRLGEEVVVSLLVEFLDSGA
jgi:hypothetical protein